jgi:hypothetical protein
LIGDAQRAQHFPPCLHTRLDVALLFQVVLHSDSEQHRRSEAGGKPPNCSGSATLSGRNARHDSSGEIRRRGRWP